MHSGFTFELALDHGTAAPAVCLLCARSEGAFGPDGRYYPRDSVVVVDEVATNEPGSLTRGMGYTVGRICDEILAMCTRWSVEPEGVGDSAIFAAHGSDSGSIGDEYRRCGVHLRRSAKGDRRHGWEVMRRMLLDAGKPDVPGLYVSRACAYFWATVPFLARDPRRPDDVDSRGPDHCADALRYFLMDDSGTDELAPVFL